MIVLILAFLLCSIYVLTVRKRRRKQKEEGFSSVVLPGKLLAALYLVCAICVCFACFTLEMDYVPYVASLIAAFLMLVLIAGCRYIVFYNEQEIRVSKAFGGYRMICCSDIHSVHLGPETITIYEHKRYQLPNWFAQGSPFMIFLQKYVKSDKAKNWRHMPRALKDSVYDPSVALGGSLILSVLGCVVIFMGLLIPELREYLLAFLVFGLVMIGWTPLMIVSVKRAHLSAFWDMIARFCSQEIALIPAVFSSETVLFHLEKERNIVFLYQNQRYIIMPGDYSVYGRKYTLAKITVDGDEEILHGSRQEILEYEFNPGVSFLSQIWSFEFLYIFKKARIVKA